MKNMIKYFVAIVVTLTFAFTSYAAEPTSAAKKSTNAFEQNLLVGLGSDNEGLQTSAAYYLGEIKSNKAVLPLMKILHSSQSEDARIMAALSLYKIGDERGLFAVKENGRFDESEKVRRMCENFTRTHQIEKHKK